MKKFAVFFLTLVVCLCGCAPLYAQIRVELYNPLPSNSTLLDNSIKKYLREERYETRQQNRQRFSIISLFKSKAFAAPKNADEERRKIRDEWKEMLGLDVFYPYFKAQEIESFVQEKASVRLLDMKGKPEFNRESKEVRYIFKRKF